MENERGEDTDTRVFRVTDPYYNHVHSPRFARPHGAERALLLRGLRGGYIVLDIYRWQIYKPNRGRHAGHDFVCATVNTLWSLGDRRVYLENERAEGHKCPGYTHLREHTGRHHFSKNAVLLLQLRHRLRLRVVLARSTVIVNDRLYFKTMSMTFLTLFQRLAPLFFKRLYWEHFPDATLVQVDGARDFVLEQMSSALRSSAVDGVLFSGGNEGHFCVNPRGVIGEGSVIRSQCTELQRVFSPDDVIGLEGWARCYEWTHWSTVMTALGSIVPLLYQFMMESNFSS